jgi:hypothetical protein
VPILNESDARKTTESSQSLELSDELNKWIETFVNSDAKEGKGAVSMFKTIGSRHGGNAKIVGNATHVNGTPIAKSSGEVGGGKDDWDEIALAHYPSILHFRDMLASEDYQEVNKRHRVPSLRDTCILMTSEIVVGEVMREGKGGAKL